MSKVGNYGLIILTPPLKPEIMSKYQKNIDPGNKAQSPFTYFLSIQPRKEEKTQWENPPLNMDRKNKIFGNIVINHASHHDQQSPAVI